MPASYRDVELWDHVQWKKFKDGWPNIFIDNVPEIAGRDGEERGRGGGGGTLRYITWEAVVKLTPFPTGWLGLTPSPFCWFSQFLHCLAQMDVYRFEIPGL